MNDTLWYETLKQRYDEKAAELTAKGWTVQNKGMSFCEHFTHPEHEPVQIVRKLGSRVWTLTRYYGK